MNPLKTPRPGPTRAALLARIHCLAKEAGWSDEEYRDIVQAKTGKRSAGELDFATLERVVREIGRAVGGSHPHLKPAPERPKDTSEWGFVHRAAEEKRPLLRKIFAVCRDLGVGRTYAEGVAKRQNMGAERRLEMMSYDELYKVAQALTTTQKGRVKQAAKAAPDAVGAQHAAPLPEGAPAAEVQP